jgi:hypothetical protein
MTMPAEGAVSGRRRRGRRVRAVTAATLLAAATTAWVSHGDVGAQGEPPLDPAAFSATVDNPLFPISKLRFTRSRGVERTESGRRIRLRVEIRVLARKMRVAGVPVTVVEDNDFENGRLVEHTFDYFAQDRDGNVWYFGERIDEYERGRLVGHEGQWLAGEHGAKPGLFMPAAPKVGAAFAQERAPGVAEDRTTVLAVGLRVRTPARVFRGCIKVRDFSPLDRTTEFKYYCPGVGIAREVESGARFDVVSFG